jgi:hypothetical protein
MKTSHTQKSKKNLIKNSVIIVTFVSFFLATNSAYAWNGYDYDNKTEIEIGPGNLVREGLVIQFYDSKDDQYHTAKISFIDEVAGGSRIQLRDLDTKKDRTFIMQAE